MGTNFYIRYPYAERIHIGKRSSMARPEGAKVNPMLFTFAISILSIKRKDTIIDEYNNCYTYNEFFKLVVEKCAVVSFKLGEVFS